MINFVIVEDNKAYREKIEKMIVSYMMSNKNAFKITKFKDYDESISEYINKNKYFNIYILDFELPNGTAIDIAREIRESDWISPIIILTAYSSLALDTFKQRLQILDFLGKQLDVEKNKKELLDICMSVLGKDINYKYTYHNVDHNIPINSIQYVMRDGRRIAIVTDEKTFYQNISITKIKSLLGKNFIYSSKGIIVNMKRVKTINWNKQQIIFDNGQKKNIISKSHKKELEEYEYN